MFCNVMLLLLYVHVCVTRTGWKTRPRPKTVILLIKQSINQSINLSLSLPFWQNLSPSPSINSPPLSLSLSLSHFLAKPLSPALFPSPPPLSLSLSPSLTLSGYRAAWRPTQWSQWCCLWSQLASYTDESPGEVWTVAHQTSAWPSNQILQMPYDLQQILVGTAEKHTGYIRTVTSVVLLVPSQNRVPCHEEH